MAKRTTTVGRLLLDRELPPDLRSLARVIDKKGGMELFQALAIKHPEQYREISHKLAKLGYQTAFNTGGMSFGVDSLQKSDYGKNLRREMEARLASVLDDDSLDDKRREEEILKLIGPEVSKQQEAVYQEAMAKGNPLADQVRSGSRGNKMNLSSLLGSDLLYVDHRNHPLPLPVLHSYSEGLRPLEYFAGAYGARKGIVDVKLGVAKSGFLGKQLNQATHRLLVTEDDAQDAPKTLRGLPVDTNDPDNAGALLAAPAGRFPRNTILTPKILAAIHADGHHRILVRSPITGGPRQGGLYAKDVGIREFGGFPTIGSQVGLSGAQALNEPITQGTLSSKHSGGVAGASKATSGFDWINSLVQSPKTLKGGATHAQLDGTVDEIRPAPAGGWHVVIGGQEHYVPQGLGLKVSPKQVVEAGDVLSEGIPNSGEAVRHKGIGEGRRYFMQAFGTALRDSDLKADRRNIELVARGLINHITLTDEVGDNVPGDTITYDALENSYEPREGFETKKVDSALGHYLEAPYLHYSIGTKVRPSVQKELKEFGINSVDVHRDPPPFEPEMVRGMYTLQHDPDWLTRELGSGLKKSLLDAVHHGNTSNELGTSYVPGLAKGVGFGQRGLVVTPKPVQPIKAAEDADTLNQLLAAKGHSDRGDYAQKHQVMSKLMRERPDEFTIDSPHGYHYGVTHTPTKFKMHVPRDIIPIALRQRQISQQRAVEIPAVLRVKQTEEKAAASPDANYMGTAGAASGTHIRPPTPSGGGLLDIGKHLGTLTAGAGGAGGFRNSVSSAQFDRMVNPAAQASQSAVSKLPPTPTTSAGRRTQWGMNAPAGQTPVRGYISGIGSSLAGAAGATGAAIKNIGQLAATPFAWAGEQTGLLPQGTNQALQASRQQTVDVRDAGTHQMLNPRTSSAYSRAMDSQQGDLERAGHGTYAAGARFAADTAPSSLVPGGIAVGMGTGLAGGVEDAFSGYSDLSPEEVAERQTPTVFDKRSELKSAGASNPSELEFHGRLKDMDVTQLGRLCAQKSRMKSAGLFGAAKALGGAAFSRPMRRLAMGAGLGAATVGGIKNQLGLYDPTTTEGNLRHHWQRMMGAEGPANSGPGVLEGLAGSVGRGVSGLGTMLGSPAQSAAAAWQHFRGTAPKNDVMTTSGTPSYTPIPGAPGQYRQTNTFQKALDPAEALKKRQAEVYKNWAQQYMGPQQPHQGQAPFFAQQTPPAWTVPSEWLQQNDAQQFPYFSQMADQYDRSSM